MYSRIPIPSFPWDEKSMRYVMCYFPLIGLVIGGAECLWFWLSHLLNLPGLVAAAIAAVIPILITGGIHMDGFCDTVDALSSQQDRERRLEILKDSHAGAFAIIFAGVYMIVTYGCWNAVTDWKRLGAVCVGFVLSRALSALALATFQGARKKGMLQGFADAAKKKTVTITMLVYIVLCAVGMIALGGWLGLIMVCANGIVFLYYRITAYKKFGGTTGDLAGWFLQLAELSSVLCVGIFGFVL
ncbi:MAG: adenosylcobinamide-GDP ribazoletransferase [Parasporobacterium sp.]|nr:adenosylcobinamide-GDP ribazoletransferase [Parasporobacterium sp.]